MTWSAPLKAFPHLAEAAYRVSVPAAGHDASARLHTFAFPLPDRLRARAAALEKSSESRCQAAIPDPWGVPRVSPASESHGDFGKDLLSPGLACPRALLPSLLPPGVFSGPQQSI